MSGSDAQQEEVEQRPPSYRLSRLDTPAKFENALATPVQYLYL